MIKQKLKAFIQFIANPRFLLCFGIAWMITNGWAYVLLGVGTFLKINWMIVVSGTYLAILWFPFTPEKILTVAISILFLKWWFPQDTKTLGVLKTLSQKAKTIIQKRKNEKQQVRQNKS